MDHTEEIIVKVIDLSGSYYKIGLKQANELMSSSLQKQMDFFHKLTSSSNSLAAYQILKDVAPNLLLELKGLSAGLNVSFDRGIKLFSGYDLTFPQMGCTAFINDGYYVRNYDFSPEMYDARFVFNNPMAGYASVGFSQQIIGRLDGMNEKGLVVGLHFVNNEYKKEGFIATMIVRILLEQCKNVDEAVTLIKKLPHSYCYNYSMTDQSGRGVVVEASPEKQVITYEMPVICTNHFCSNFLKESNKENIEDSINRKEYVRNLLKERLSIASAYHHFNNADSPIFYKNYTEYFGTLHTVVYSPQDLSVTVGIGENNKPMKFSLKKYIDGTLILPEDMKGIISYAK